MKSILYFVFVIFFSLPAFAQNVTFESYGKAREVLDRSIAALYGFYCGRGCLLNIQFSIGPL